MNLTARQYHLSVLITAAWRARLLVITDDGVPIEILSGGAEPSGTSGSRMAILRAACVFVGRRASVFNCSTRELVVTGLVSAARLPRLVVVVADDLGSVHLARCTKRSRGCPIESAQQASSQKHRDSPDRQHDQVASCPP